MIACCAQSTDARNGDRDDFFFMGFSIQNDGAVHAAAGRVCVLEPGASRAIHGQWHDDEGCSAMHNV